MTATFAETVGDEVFVYVLGRLVMKRWLRTGSVGHVPRRAEWRALELPRRIEGGSVVTLNDSDMLNALLDADRAGECLHARERDAFADMLLRINQGHATRLTALQREWVQKRYRQLELDAAEGSLNLYSSGQVPEGRKIVCDYEKLPHPTIPPHRLARMLAEAAEAKGDK